MRPHDDELRLEELDDQIEWYARGQRAGGWPSPTTQLIQGLRKLHENEQADGQSVEEVWQRLVERGAVSPALAQRRAGLSNSGVCRSHRPGADKINRGAAGRWHRA